MFSEKNETTRQNVCFASWKAGTSSSAINFDHRFMRVVGEIPHPECKITIFHWNNRYLIKIEAGPFEQTFKVNDYDISSEADLNRIISPEFIGQAIARFSDMSRSLAEATDQI
jgi:hypothetical protein